MAEPGSTSACWRYGQLALVAGVYMAASSAEVLVVKVMNYQLHVSLVILTAMLLNSYWVLQLPLYLWLRTPDRVLTRQQLIGYLVIGALAAAVTGMRSYGLNALPGSVYVVCATSDLVFNTILSRVFLKKRFTMFHYGAVVIAMGGIALVATESTQSTHYHCDGDTCADDFLPGILMAVGSALASAINSVVADKILSVDKKSFLGVAEVSLFNSMVPFSILWIPMLATTEYTRYDDAVRSVRAQDALALFIVLCVALGLSKMLDRATKFTLVTMKGAFFYAITDSVRKVLTGLLAIWALGEASSWRKYAALGLTAIAMGVYVYGSYLNKQAAAKAAAAKAAAGALTGGSDAPLLLPSEGGAPRAPSAPLSVASAPRRGSSRWGSMSSTGGSIVSYEALEELDLSVHGMGLSQSPGMVTLPPGLLWGEPPPLPPAGGQAALLAADPGGL